MEYLVDPMDVFGIICKSGGPSDCTFKCECYEGNKECNGTVYVDIDVPVCPSKTVCQCKDGREACGNGGYSPMFIPAPL